MQAVRWILFSTLLIFGFTLTGYAQGSSTPYSEFSIGYIKPEDTGGGNVFSLSSGRRLDDRLFWGFQLDYFRASYRQTTTISDSTVSGISFQDKQLELEFSTRFIGTYFRLSYENKLSQQSPFFLRVATLIGGGFVFNNENNYIENVERDRSFRGFGWKVNAGIGMKISRTGVVFGEVMYNQLRAINNKDSTQEGLPLWQEINLSGLGFQVGINVIGFGF